MGTIKIFEYNSVGTAANRDAPVYDLETLLATTVDATTSTSAESVTLNLDTRLVAILAEEDHRICLGSDTTATKYMIAPAGLYVDVNVTPGGTLYYELDA